MSHRYLYGSDHLALTDCLIKIHVKKPQVRVLDNIRDSSPHVVSFFGWVEDPIIVMLLGLRARLLPVDPLIYSRFDCA